MEKMNLGKKLAIFWAAVITCVLLFGSVHVFAATKTVNLPQNKWYNSKSEKYRDVYHKITVPKTGYIKLEGWEYYSTHSGINGLKIQICNSKKKPMLENDMWITSYTGGKVKYITYTALKKGTYYIHTKNVGNYKLKYSVKAVSDKSGSSKAKARTVARNKTVSGLFLVGEGVNKTDWYKIRVPATKTVTFTLSSKTDNYIFFYVFDAKGRFLESLDCIGAAKSQKLRLKKGTYYIQAKRYLKNITGPYSLKWK